MKGLLRILLLLETFVFVVQQHVDGGVSGNEISQQLSNEDRRQNPPQTDALRDEASTDSQRNYPVCYPDIYAALTELTVTVTEQKANIRALETRLKDAEEAVEQQTVFLKELNKTINDREIAFSTALLETSTQNVGPYTTDITLNYKVVFTNVGNAYNPNTGIFTAPLKGVYVFQISVYGEGHPSYPSSVYLIKNGQRVVMVHGQQASYAVTASKGVVLILEVGDVVFVRLWAGSRLQDNKNYHNTFSGYLLFPLGESKNVIW
ncbi:Complement C1q-like protein 4 [Labeo rohita]|uniref:Complement C1q-like protein 4 n=1 Tax=Labeo rohita TaxID=84645 RepID=A0ABQ8L4W0_LABRO|nr:complement C1q-like protein 2 [Labeo rohita]KAI2644997.1 Complement C1q-like protein 4 [Labeo rohita]